MGPLAGLTLICVVGALAAPALADSPVGQTAAVVIGLHFPDGKTDPATGIIDPLRDSRDPDPASLYPMQSRMNGEHGTAIIGYVVTTDGSVVDTTVVKSSGYPRLDEAALAQVKAWHCRPAMKDGHAIPVVMATRISFEQR
jgi:TonB family protein